MVKVGIYKIRNIINNNIYIGSSNNIKKRWIKHFSLLKRNCHHSSHLQNAWNKYGEFNFEFSILEECKEDELLLREQYYLDKLLLASEYIKGNNNFFIKNGYNIKPFCESNLGFKHSIETIEKINKARNISVLAIDINGNILGEYLTSALAAVKYDINISKVQTCLKNKKCSRDLLTIGFIYKKEHIKGFCPSPAFKEKQKNKAKINDKPVYVYSIYGKFIEKVKNQTICSKKYNITTPNLSGKLNRKNKRVFKNYIFLREKTNEYVESLQQKHNKLMSLNCKNPKFKILDMDENVICAYDNIKEISKIIGCNLSSAYLVLDNKRDTIFNYKIQKIKMVEIGRFCRES